MNEITPIKRRGRPPGSKNRLSKARINPLDADLPLHLPSPAPEPPLVFEGLTEAIINPGLSVKLRKSRLPTAFGDTSKRWTAGNSEKEPVDHEVEWPAGWPLPSNGQVVLHHEVSGQTNSVEFDLDNHVILITLK